MKRFISLVIAVAMIMTMLFVGAVQAGAKPNYRMKIYIIPDKTDVILGDVINYTIMLGPVSELGTIQMALVIPSGLSYVAGSGKVDPNVRNKMGFDYLSFDYLDSDSSLILCGYASAGDYNSTTNTTLGTFQCKVSHMTSDPLVVGLTYLEMGSCQSFEVFTDLFDVVTTDVTYKNMQIKVIPDKTKANPGDVINYSIVLGSVSKLGFIMMELDIPSGLSYVAGSGKVDPNARNKMGFDYLGFDDSYLILNGYASAADYNSTTDTTLGTFQCKVDCWNPCTLSVGLKYLEMGSCQAPDFVDISTHFEVVKTDISVISYIIGDLDEDGEVGVLDATYILRYDAGFNTPINEDVMMLCGDIDGDEEVGVLDATLVLRYDAYFPTPYKIGEYISGRSI